MSGAMAALQSLGIKPTNYYACEIDKYSEAVSRFHYPDIIRLGDVRRVSFVGLPKIDLLVAGFPCQSFSFAGQQLNFNDPRGKLFFEVVRLLQELQPKFFILENVIMKKDIEAEINKLVGVKPVVINSALLSAQNRKRNYWVGGYKDGGVYQIDIQQPNNKGILLKDIIEDGECDREKSLVVTTRVAGATAHRYLTKSLHQMIKVCNTNAANEGIVDRDKSLCLDANYAKGGNPKQYFEKHRPQLVFGAAQRGRYNEDGTTSQLLEINGTYKANTITTVQKDSLCGEVIDDKIYWRKLTALECERLQTFPDDYTKYGVSDRGNQIIISNSQRYKMLGNGFTRDVIAHIIQHIPDVDSFKNMSQDLLGVA